MRTTVASDTSSGAAAKKVVEKRRTIWQTILDILRSDGPGAFFHGLGPALILVSNPILQFTVRPLSPGVSPTAAVQADADRPRPQLFEQLKNLILRRRALRLTKGSAGAPPLTDLDFFLLGAVTKLFATSVTYPCASRRRSLARACDRRAARVARCCRSMRSSSFR